MRSVGFFVKISSIRFSLTSTYSTLQDHALELQLTASALTAAGFCTAWDAMRAAWKKYDRHRNVDQIMRQQFFDGGFKATANDFRMLFYVDTRFNEIVRLFILISFTSIRVSYSIIQKRAFTASYLRGSHPQTTTQLQNYFHAGVVDIVDNVATSIDAAAYGLLDTINALATPQHYDEETATDAEKELVCALDTAQTTVSAPYMLHNCISVHRSDTIITRRSDPGTTPSKVIGLV